MCSNLTLIFIALECVCLSGGIWCVCLSVCWCGVRRAESICWIFVFLLRSCDNWLHLMEMMSIDVRLCTFLATVCYRVKLLGIIIIIVCSGENWFVSSKWKYRAYAPKREKERNVWVCYFLRLLVIIITYLIAVNVRVLDCDCRSQQAGVISHDLVENAVPRMEKECVRR